jgi:hypothetical protein
MDAGRSTLVSTPPYPHNIYLFILVILLHNNYILKNSILLNYYTFLIKMLIITYNFICNFNESTLKILNFFNFIKLI